MVKYHINQLICLPDIIYQYSKWEEMAQYNETAVNLIDCHTFCLDQQYTEILNVSLL